MAAPKVAKRHPWETAEYNPRVGHVATYAFRLHLDSLFPHGYKPEQHREGFDKQEIEDWKDLASIPDAIAQLHRFSHRDQTRFWGKVLPDGSNINVAHTMENGGIVRNGSQHMLDTHKFYRAWLSLLHYDGLLQLNLWPSPGVTFNIDDTIITSHLEVDAIREMHRLGETHYDKIHLDHLWDIPLATEHMWIRDWRNVVLTTLTRMRAASGWAELNNENELLAIRQAYTTTLFPVTKVFVRLLAKEIDFETRLQRFHVEDELYQKRLSLMSPENATRLGPGIYSSLETEYWPRMQKSVEVLQSNLRSIYDYRLIRDWAHRRAWLKLFMVFDTSKDQELHDAVTQIQDWYNEEKDKRNWDLFDVQPVIMGRIPDNTSCSICVSDFEDNELVMQTHCRHEFHAQCLMEYWDTEYKFDYNCPNCRQSPGRLRDRAEILFARKQDFGDEEQRNIQEDDLGRAHDLMEDGVRFEDLPFEVRVAWERHREHQKFKLGMKEMKDSGLGIV